MKKNKIIFDEVRKDNSIDYYEEIVDECETICIDGEVVYVSKFLKSNYEDYLDYLDYEEYLKFNQLGDLNEKELEEHINSFIGAQKIELVEDEEDWIDFSYDFELKNQILNDCQIDKLDFIDFENEIENKRNEVYLITKIQFTKKLIEERGLENFNEKKVKRIFKEKVLKYKIKDLDKFRMAFFTVIDTKKIFGEKYLPNGFINTKANILGVLNDYEINYLTYRCRYIQKFPFVISQLKWLIDVLEISPKK